MTSRRNVFRCRRCAGLVLLIGLAGCADDSEPGAEPAPPPPAATRATPQATAPRESPRAVDTGAATYYEAYLDETLRGDFNGARSAYRRVLDNPSVEPEVAARAALRLAEYEASPGPQRRRHLAIDLVARAASLGRGHRELLQWAQRLQKRIAAVRVEDIEVRGPPAGTPLEGVSPEAADLFARAEVLLANYHRRRLRPRLEDLRASERQKRNALETAVRAYRQVVAVGEPAAVVAAEFRIASLYYDLSLSLTFDLPPELDPSAAAADALTRWRQSVRAKALADRNNARKAYLRALDAGRDGRAGPAGAVWLEAAELGLRSVEDLLRRRE